MIKIGLKLIPSLKYGIFPVLIKNGFAILSVRPEVPSYGKFEVILGGISDYKKPLFITEAFYNFS